MTTDTEVEAFGVYDFGLTPEEEERAARLHADSVVVDLLNFGPCGYRHYSADMMEHIQRSWETERDLWSAVYVATELPVRLALDGEFPDFELAWRASGITVCNRPVNLLREDHRERGMALLQRQFDTFPWLSKALTASDIREASRQDKVAGFINSQWMSPDLGVVDAFYDFGGRMLQPTYNSLNLFGAGCTERVDPGLSRLGLKLVERLNDLGIIIDVSHCGPQTTLDICAASSAPVVATHTGAWAVYGHDRAKTDEALLAIAETGGLIGVYAVPFFLGAATSVSVTAMLDHVGHIVKTTGFAHVGIGTDWPMQMPKWTLENVFARAIGASGFDASHGLDMTRTVVGFDDLRDFPNLTRGLVHLGYTDDAIKAIMGENFVRVFGQVCG